MMIDKFLFEIFLVVCVLGVALLLAALTARRCPTCNSTGVYYQHARKDGGPDQRYKYNPLICRDCEKAKRTAPTAVGIAAQTPGQQGAPVVREPSDIYKAGDWIVYDGAMVTRLGTLAKICVQVEIDLQGVMQPFARLHRNEWHYRHATPDEIERALEGDNVNYYNQDGTRDTFYQPIKKSGRSDASS
jgi:hypothetical protein